MEKAELQPAVHCAVGKTPRRGPLLIARSPRKAGRDDQAAAGKRHVHWCTAVALNAPSSHPSPRASPAKSQPAAEWTAADGASPLSAPPRAATAALEVLGTTRSH